MQLEILIVTESSAIRETSKIRDRNENRKRKVKKWRNRRSNFPSFRNQLSLPETSESEPGVGLASTLCLDPWQHSLHLLHIVPGNIKSTWTSLSTYLRGGFSFAGVIVRDRRRSAWKGVNPENRLRLSSVDYRAQTDGFNRRIRFHRRFTIFPIVKSRVSIAKEFPTWDSLVTERQNRPNLIVQRASLKVQRTTVKISWDKILSKW